MSRGARWTGSVLLAFWAVTATALAVAPEVQDQGRFFSPEAVKKADEQIRDIYRKHNFDLLIESFAAPPAGQAEKFRAADKKERLDLFLKWAQERSKARAVRGVYILLCKEPRYLLVGVTPKAQKEFSAEARSKLQGLIRDAFAKDRFDQGLQAAVSFVTKELAKSSAK